MTYTDFIAVIDLGTSHMVGMVGTKNENGVLSIIAYDVEKSESCIRRGCVYNVEETANKIKRLILKLENKLSGSKIGKIYIGVGSKSIRTIDHTVSKVLGAEGEVTSAVLKQLEDECRAYQPSMLDVLEVTSPVYLLDGKEENEPLGISCSRIEARYKLIVAQPTIRRSIMTNIADRIKLPIAGIIVAPLALADLVLTPADKQGAVLIDFGAGVTSVTIFKNGRLVALTVVPLGAGLITRDIMSLRVTEMEAERLKRTYGSALPLDRDKEQQKIEINKMDDYRSQEMLLADLNEIIEARSREIVKNAYARLEDAGVAKEPGFSVTIAGCGSALSNLREAVSECFDMEVHYPLIRKGTIDSSVEMIANNPDFTTAVALLLHGKENCALRQEPKTEPKVTRVQPKVTVEEPTPKVEVNPVTFENDTPTKPVEPVQPTRKPTVQEPSRPQTEKISWWVKLKQKADFAAGEIFKEEDYDNTK